MSMAGCSKFFRVVLVIINVLFFIIGVLMFSFGAALKSNPIGLFNMITDVFKDNSGVLENALTGVTDGVGIFMVVVGCIVAAVAIWGIVAAVLSNKPMLIIYAVIVSMVLCAEIALIIVAVLYPSAVNLRLVGNFTEDDVYFYNSSAIAQPASGVGRFWYLIQNQFSCCGFRNYSEFTSTIKPEYRKPYCSPAYAATHPFCNKEMAVLASCCKKNYNGRAIVTQDSDFVNLEQCAKGDPASINTNGCLDAFFRSSEAIPVAIAAVTLGIMVLLIISASCAIHVKKYAKV